MELINGLSLLRDGLILRLDRLYVLFVWRRHFFWRRHFLWRRHIFWRRHFFWRRHIFWRCLSLICWQIHLSSILSSDDFHVIILSSRTLVWALLLWNLCGRPGRFKQGLILNFSGWSESLVWFLVRRINFFLWAQEKGINIFSFVLVGPDSAGAHLWQ